MNSSMIFIIFCIVLASGVDLIIKLIKKIYKKNYKKIYLYIAMTVLHVAFLYYGGSYIFLNEKKDISIWVDLVLLICVIIRILTFKTDLIE
ncbi:hypothetical protein JHL18_08730 [Clostridium sp. YIM B02505]|uniref:Uncharacterized protein n=1 Tax=Clostridium yunnanense TaxID=2800325 RepID=A0ABS1EMX7_9CLOT|nr:hypothetical protein [Clostridium yunnanense]MBK1810721.1 hypothetical protein [Clostridium yunnanense]